jgi:hypothetical protein
VGGVLKYIILLIVLTMLTGCATLPTQMFAEAEFGPINVISIDF